MSNSTGETKEIRWYVHETDQVFNKLNSGKDGLSPEEAEHRLEEYGLNKLPEGKKKSALIRFLLHFHNMLIYVLMAAGVVTALLDHWIDTWVIVAVILINAIIGFVQEGKAEKALESIKKMLSLEANVIRDGTRKTIDAEKLVPGDVVFMKSGDKVPADIRLFDIRNFQIEESALTGESVATEKSTAPVDEGSVPGDQTCMAFSGTSVVSGQARGVVVGTGGNTELGKIKQMMTDVEKITTPLLRQIDSFGRILSVVIIAVTVLFFTFGFFFRDYQHDELFLAVISLAVAAIPEGLPAIMTITLAVGVQAMARKNAIIRKLPSVETLGSVAVICSDKTGTLTRNEMTATSIVTAEAVYLVQGSGYEPRGDIKNGDEIVSPVEDSILADVIKTVRVCNEATIKEKEGEWVISGNPTEAALITLAHKAGLDSFKPGREDVIPFESDHKYMATLNKIENGSKRIFVKGAPEILMDLCSKQKSSNGTSPLDKDFWENEMQKQAENGRRLIAAAYKDAESDQATIEHEDIQEGLIFLGVIGMIDPPREEAIEAIKVCKKAGILVKMITGDHVITARAIGKEIGIGNGVKAISGAELEEMNDDELRKAAVEYDIFARTSPEHKLRLVKALQAENLICAMTGDGVNDAPALKRADVGIAMGIKGTEVTKEASEMVLADDNFASIASAVEEGRTIYDNLRKAILFILPTNGAESLVIMAALVMGIVMPITPVQILWVNMVTAVTLALALSFEPTEKGVMSRPPRKSGAPILGAYFLWRVVFVSILIGGITLTLYYWLMDNGYEIETSRTIAVNTLVAGQLFYLFNCRKMYDVAIGKDFFTNKYAFIAAAALIVFQMIFTYAPFMHEWFGTYPIELSYWIFPLVSGIAVFILVEIEKILFGKKRLAKERRLNGE